MSGPGRPSLNINIPDEQDNTRPQQQQQQHKLVEQYIQRKPSPGEEKSEEQEQEQEEDLRKSVHMDNNYLGNQPQESKCVSLSGISN